MHETDTPEPAVAADDVLDGFEADFDDVAAALEALDADDLDTAEGLVAGLGPVDSVPPVGDGDHASEPG